MWITASKFSRVDGEFSKLECSAMVASCDIIWLKCCAFHNMLLLLLAVDGLDEG